MERTDWDTIYQDIMDNGFFLLFLLSNVIKDDVFQIEQNKFIEVFRK